jgi:signal transduction histidine kinase
VQLDRGLTRTNDGTGLGLAISRGLARGMGGEIMLKSDVGAGSVFTVTIPLAAPRATPALNMER